MYSTPGEPDQVPTSLATDILSDDTGQVLKSLEYSLTKARSAMQARAGTAGRGNEAHDLRTRLDSAFEVAWRILESARVARSRRT